MQPTTAPSPAAAFITEMTERMAALAQHLAEWAASEARTLDDLEQETLALVKDLGNALLAGACQVAATATPAAPQPCPCGRRRLTPRQRPAQVLTVLGPIRLSRP